MDYSLPGSTVHGISHARILLPPPGDFPDPGIEPASPALVGGFFTTEPLGRPVYYLGFYYLSFRLCAAWRTCKCWKKRPWLVKVGEIDLAISHFSSQNQQIQANLFLKTCYFILINNVVIVSGGQQRDSAIYIHVFILFQAPLLTRQHWAEFQVLYNRSLLSIHFKYSGVIERYRHSEGEVLWDVVWHIWWQ